KYNIEKIKKDKKEADEHKKRTEDEREFIENDRFYAFLTEPKNLEILNKLDIEDSDIELNQTFVGVGSAEWTKGSATKNWFEYFMMHTPKERYQLVAWDPENRYMQNNNSKEETIN